MGDGNYQRAAKLVRELVEIGKASAMAGSMRPEDCDETLKHERKRRKEIVKELTEVFERASKVKA